MGLFRRGQTGIRDISSQQLALVQAQAELLVASTAEENEHAQASSSEKLRKGDTAAPSPYEEEEEATAAAETQAKKAEAESATLPQAGQARFVLPNPSTDTGYDAVPLLDQLAMTNPFLQHQVLQAMSRPGGVIYEDTATGGLKPDSVAPKPVPAHLLDPYMNQQQQHRTKKTWRPRFLGGGRIAAEEEAEV